MPATEPDTIHNRCPHCKHVGSYSVPPKLPAVAGQCPGCKRWFSVTRKAGVAPAEVQAPAPPRAARRAAP